MTWRTVQYDWGMAAAFLLVVIPIAWGFYFLYHYRKRRLEGFANTPVLHAVVQERTPAIYWVKAVLISLAWVLGVIALMQPKGNERYITPGSNAVSAKPTTHKAILRQKAHNVIFLLDASASMDINDAYGGKTREAVAKEIADDVISKLKGESVTLYAFTAAAMQVVPSTMDYLFTRLMLRQIKINEGETAGTDIESALDAVKKRYFPTPSDTTKTIVLLTDGGDTRLEGLQGQPLKEAIDAIASPLAHAEENHLRVLVVGIGSRKGSDIPRVTFEGHRVISSLELPLLRKISLAGRGQLWIANDMHSFQIADEISTAIARETTYVDTAVQAPIPEMGEGSRLYDLYYQIPLGIALIALSCWFLIPDAQRIRHKGRILETSGMS